MEIRRQGRYQEPLFIKASVVFLTARIGRLQALSCQAPSFIKASVLLATWSRKDRPRPGAVLNSRNLFILPIKNHRFSFILPIIPPFQDQPKRQENPGFYIIYFIYKKY